MDCSAEELYAIERTFDKAYTVMLNSLMELDRARIQINCFMDKDNPDREELLRRNKEQEEEVHKAFILYYGISKACEKIRLEKCR